MFQCRVVWKLLLGMSASLLVVPADASTYSDMVLSQGPVAYWRLGESSGTTAVDQVGAHNGSYENNVAVGDPGAVATDADTAATFSGGTNDRVQVNAFDVSGSGITLLAWFNAAGLANDAFVSKATGTGNNYTYWYLGRTGTNRLRARVRINGTTRQLTPNVGSTTVGQWYFAAMTYDGSTFRVYLDGVEVASAAYAGAVSTSATTNIGLGNQPTGGGNRGFNGTLDDLAVFDRALAAADIAALFAAAQDDGLRAHWPVDDGAGFTVSDATSNGNDGTTNGGPIWVQRCDGQNALSLDGIDDYINVPADPALDIIGDATLSGWFRLANTFDDTSINSVVVAEKFKNNDQNMHVALVGANYTNGAPGRGSLVFKVNGATGAFRYAWTNRTTWEAGTWYNFAIVVDADTPANNKVLINGIDDTSGSSGTTAYNDLAYSADVNIGGKQSENIPGDSYLNAEVADFRMYGYALQPGKLAAIASLIGQWTLDETTGARAFDLSVAANHGVYTNGVTLGGTGPASGTLAADFDGIDDYVDMPSDASDFSNGFTIVAWGRPTSAARWARFVDFGAGQNQYNVVLSRVNRTANLEVAVYDGTLGGKKLIRASGALVLNEWHHYAATVDSTGQAKLYVDAVELASGNVGLPLNVTRNLNYIARSNWPGHDYYQGQMYDVRVYNRGLCPEEIQAIYNPGAGGFQGVKIIKWIEVQ